MKHATTDENQTINWGDISTQDNDPMLTCMALVAAHLHIAVHAASLKSGFATDEKGQIPAKAYPEIAERHGMTATWCKTSLRKLPNFSLPAVLPCKDGRAIVCIRAERNDDSENIWVLSPETGLQEQRISVADLEDVSTGNILLVQRKATESKNILDPVRGKSYIWFWNTLWRFKGYYAESMVATVVANVLTLSTVFFTMNVYDRVVPTQAYASLWTLAIGTMLAIILEFAMRWVKARLVDIGGKKADLAINATLLREIMSIRLEHRPQSIGVFASSMRDFESVRDFFSSASFILLTELPFVFLFVGMIFIIGGPVGWIPLFAIVLVLAMTIFTQPALKSAMQTNIKEAGEKQSVLVEAVMHLEAVKAFNAESYLQRRWETSNEVGAHSYKIVRSQTNLMLGLTSSLGQLISVGVILIGVYQIHANALTLGGLIASVILAGRVIGPLSGLVGLAARLQQAASALKTLDDLVAREKDKEFERRYLLPQPPVLPAKNTGNVCTEDGTRPWLDIKEIEFTYPNEQSRLVIRKISMSFLPGSRTALLGRIGCGKSTLLKIAAGLYKPNSGQILISGVDINQIDPLEFRRMIGWVGQDPMLFLGTLRENLVLADSWITDQRIIEVLQQLDLYSMVAAHSKGLDMPLSEAGGGLSGGQRQLISIARMMLRNPHFVLLDEPTANMDQNTELRVLSVLRNWLQGRTLILATHRPQLLDLVDSIAVIDAGRCVTQGRRDEIISRLAKGISLDKEGVAA